MEVTSNGSRYFVNSSMPMASAVPPTQLPNSTGCSGGSTDADQECQQRNEGTQERESGDLSKPRFAAALLCTGVQQHNDEDKEHHDGAAVDDHLRHGNEFRAQQQIENRERAHDADERQSTRDRMLLKDQVQRRNRPRQSRRR